MSSIRYDMEGEQSPYAEVKLLHVTLAQSDTDWHSTPHTHAFVELFYCLRGTGQFYIAGKYRNVGADDLVIINPSVEHTEVATSKEPLEYIALGVGGIEFILNKNEELPFLVYNFKDHQDEIAMLVKTIMQEVDSKNELYEVVCRNLLEILLIRIFKYIDGEAVATDGRDHKNCVLAKHYIDTHYAENISLDYLADMAHLNKYYLVHAFVKEYSISPINYLTARRIRESKYLLANTDHTLSQISGILGFSSPAGFSRSFKKLENKTPWEYRKAHQAGHEQVRLQEAKKEVLL
ncbi:MAG: AraC family transcriptional regulator [Clostridia bacterium]